MPVTRIKDAMRMLALLLSLLALGAVGLVACDGGDDEDTATEAKLSRKHVRELRRGANDWASRFATNDCNRYMGQPMCERLDCQGHVTPIENCTPVSAAFQKSFADATIEDIKSERMMLVGWADRPYHLAAVKFTNGEEVVVGGVLGPEPPAGSCAGAGSGCVWNIAEPDQNRRFLEAAAPRE
jgi:hypothetical protein